MAHPASPLSRPFRPKPVPNDGRSINMFESTFPRISSTTNPHRWSLVPADTYMNNPRTVLAGSWPDQPVALLDPYCYYPKTTLMKRDFWVPNSVVSGDTTTARFVEHPRISENGPFDFQLEYDGSGKAQGRFGVAVSNRRGNGKVFYTLADDSHAGPEVFHSIHQEAEGLNACLEIAEQCDMHSFRMLGDCGDLINLIKSGNGPDLTHEEKYGSVTCDYIRGVKRRYDDFMTPMYNVCLQQVFREAIPIADHLCRYTRYNIGREERTDDHLTDTTKFLNARYESGIAFLRYPIYLV